MKSLTNCWLVFTHHLMPFTQTLCFAHLNLPSKKSPLLSRNSKTMKPLNPPFLLSSTLPIKEKSLLYANKAHCYGSGGGVPRTRYDNFDWGNTKNRDGICFHCGSSSHITQNCMAYMPTDVKECILNHHAHHAHTVQFQSIRHHLLKLRKELLPLSAKIGCDVWLMNWLKLYSIVTKDTLTVLLSCSFELTLALSWDHNAHTAIDPSGWCIFGPDEDVPIKFQTANGYISND